ncbi:MAG: tRNA lysidine(34) synthetase TilS [Flavobacteriaceae bacterium]|nr:tRNA lysidine(34) synthetase TilS [Flavobacteriaceae bacterium]
MLQRFQEHINKNFPFIKGKKILIAISGGLDSVVLTHLLNVLKISEVALAHCNFKLRGIASDGDEIFVKKLSQKSSNQIFTAFFDTKTYATDNKISIQIAARELRYQWFQEIAKNHNFDYIATAHHADDNLETFLINLSRGSGLEGFTGIPSKNGNIIRPLLEFSRAEISNYATTNKLEWREDSSNAETKYIRNKIRHKIVPVLKEINPNLLESFTKTQEHLKESQQIIEDSISNIKKDIVEKDDSENTIIFKIDINKIKELSNPKAYLYQLLKDYNFTEWNDLLQLLNAQTGKQVFSEYFRLLKNRNYLLLVSRNNESSINSFTEINENIKEITFPVHLSFTEINQVKTQTKSSIYVDKDLLKYPLKVRKWENGDYIYPTGMQGKKKVSKYFKDEKFSQIDKENTWLLCNKENDVIWIINHRQDKRFLGNQNLKIQFHS